MKERKAYVIHWGMSNSALLYANDKKDAVKTLRELNKSFSKCGKSYTIEEYIKPQPEPQE